MLDPRHCVNGSFWRIVDRSFTGYKTNHHDCIGSWIRPFINGFNVLAGNPSGEEREPHSG